MVGKCARMESALSLVFVFIAWAVGAALNVIDGCHLSYYDILWYIVILYYYFMFIVISAIIIELMPLERSPESEL